MPGRFGPTDFAACARCGSGQVHPKLLVMGPIAGVDSDSRSYVCHACGYEGREPEEVMDGYMLDVERVVAGSKTLASLDSFAVLYALSSEVLPCLDWDGRVVWREPRETLVELHDVAKALRGIGFSAMCVMDLRRLGSELGPDPALLSLLEGLDLDVYVGGGLQESDVIRLGERGFAGGLVDPFTPVIRDLLKTPKPEVPTEAIPPAPAPPPAPP